MWGLLTGFTRQQPPRLRITTEIPNDPLFGFAQLDKLW